MKTANGDDKAVRTIFRAKAGKNLLYLVERIGLTIENLNGFQVFFQEDHKERICIISPTWTQFVTAELHQKE